jgi:exportin-1
LTNEFAAIFELCQFVINQSIENPASIKQTLIRQCLKTLQTFLSWIPLGYIFQTDLVENILRNLIAPPSTRLEAIKLFTEISQVSLEDEEEQF